jgi:hypothetical protein
VAGGGSFGATSKRGTVSLVLENQFAQRWWWDLSGSYQNNKFTEASATGDIDTFQGAAGIRYAVFEWASLRLKGNVVRQQSSDPAGSNLDRETIFLGCDLHKLYKVF